MSDKSFRYIIAQEQRRFHCIGEPCIRWYLGLHWLHRSEDDGDKRTVVNPESRWSLVAEMESEREGANEGTKFTATFRKRRVGAKLGSRVTRKK